jgi:predicted small lipoprotein YifL
MKKLFGSSLLAFSLFLCTPGCGEKGPTNVGENADQSDVDAYLAAQAESEAAAEAGAADVEAAAN